jgi:hypothetical protein
MKTYEDERVVPRLHKERKGAFSFPVIISSRFRKATETEWRSSWPRRWRMRWSRESQAEVPVLCINKTSTVRFVQDQLIALVHAGYEDGMIPILRGERLMEDRYAIEIAFRQGRFRLFRLCLLSVSLLP